MIGLYGPIFFQSGSTNLSTFDGLKKTVTARWGSHEVWMDKPMLEYSGPQLIEVNFTMELIKPFTVDPLATVILLEETMDLAVPYPLIIGMKPMGRGMSLFVLTSLSHQPKYFYRSGQWLGCSVEVQLKEYPNISLSNLIQALGGAFSNDPAPDVQAGSLPSSVSQPEAAGANVPYAQAAPTISQNYANEPVFNQQFNMQSGVSATAPVNDFSLSSGTDADVNTPLPSPPSS
jgi:phage protein U